VSARQPGPGRLHDGSAGWPLVPTVGWVGPARDGAVTLIDQTLLPEEEVILEIRDLERLAEAIRELRVRGAPAIGIAGAYGVVLAAGRAGHTARDADQALRELEEQAARLAAVRPTAVNLTWAIERVCGVVRASLAAGRPPGEGCDTALAEARAIHAEDLAMSRAMGASGLPLVAPGARIVTHCNTGGLATGGLGTALAVVFAAARAGRAPRVFVDETRPLLQGARLTTWELMKAGIEATLLVDGGAAWLMASRGVDLALVGADRVAANGDAANKIGTYALAVAAARHGVPFYVVAPSSTFDAACPSGGEIVVEERPADEVRSFRGRAAAPRGVAVWNPAFDVTPAELITGWITEGGIVRPPFDFAPSGPRSGA